MLLADTANAKFVSRDMVLQSIRVGGDVRRRRPTDNSFDHLIPQKERWHEDDWCTSKIFVTH